MEDGAGNEEPGAGQPPWFLAFAALGRGTEAGFIFSRDSLSSFSSRLFPQDGPDLVSRAVRLLED